MRLTYFLLVAAAGIWLAACSAPAARSPDSTPPKTLVPFATPSSAQPKGPSSPAGGEPPTGSSPAGASGVRPAVLTAKDQGQAGVAIRATWVVPGSPEAASSGLDSYLAFAMSMDTHSGDLTQYNLMKLSVLRDDGGKETAPVAWVGTSEDSHHRAGVIKFPRGPEEGAKYVELVIRNFGGAKERVLRWDLGG